VYVRFIRTLQGQKWAGFAPPCTVGYGVRAHPNNAWNFNTDDGNQNNDNNKNISSMLAVRPGE